MDTPAEDHVLYVRFAMLDNRAARECFVVREAIEDIEQGSGAPTDTAAGRLAIFERHRGVFERIASDMYQTRERPSPKF